MSADPGTIPTFTQGDRLRISLRHAGLSAQEMADYLGVSRYTISHWMNDRNSMRRTDLMAWAMRTGVPMTWLQTGQAPQDGGPDGGLPQVDSNHQPFVLRAVA